MNILTLEIINIITLENYYFIQGFKIYVENKQVSMSLLASSYSLLFLHVDTYNHNRPSVQLYLLFSSLLFSLTLDLLISVAFSEVQVATISRSKLSLHTDRTRYLRENFSKSLQFKYSYLSFFLTFPMFGCFSPLSYQLVNHESRLYSSSFLFFFSFTPSILHFAPFRVHPSVIKTVAFSLFLYLLLDPVYSYDRLQLCTPRSVRYWQSGERHFHRERPVFLEPHRFTCCVWSWIPNPHYRYTFICSSASYARRLPFQSAFVRTSWPSIAVTVAKAGCACCLSTEKNCRFNIVTYRHAKRSYVSNVRWLAHLYSVIKFSFCFVVSSLHNNKKMLLFYTND